MENVSKSTEQQLNLLLEEAEEELQQLEQEQDSLGCAASKGHPMGIERYDIVS